MTKKVKEKEAPKEESKAKSTKVEVIAKQIGKNLNVVVGNEKFTRVGSKEELEVVKTAIKAYETKPIKSNLEAMMKVLRPVTTEKIKEQEKVKAEIKATKKKVVEEKVENKKKTNVAAVVKEIDEKMMSDEELKQMEAAIDRQKAKKAAVAQTTARPSSHSSRERY